VAAAEGSSDEVFSLPSWIVLGMWVGEWFLGVEPRPSFLEKERERDVFSGWMVTGGDITSC
jgi:hypothetical protein